MTDEGKDICRRTFWFSVPIPGDSHMQTVTKGAQTRDFNHKHVISELFACEMTESRRDSEKMSEKKVADTRVPIITTTSRASRAAPRLNDAAIYPTF